MILRARWAALLASLMLAACATPPPADRGDQLSGRLAVQVAATPSQGSRGFSANFDLRGDAERGELRLSSALGGTVGEARWSPGEARLITSDGETRHPDLDALSRQALGEAVPLQALTSWLRGRPWPGAPSTSIDGGFEQIGWRIVIPPSQPGSIDVSRERAPRVTVRVKLDPS